MKTVGTGRQACPSIVVGLDGDRFVRLLGCLGLLVLASSIFQQEADTAGREHPDPSGADRADVPRFRLQFAGVLEGQAPQLGVELDTPFRAGGGQQALDEQPAVTQAAQFLGDHTGTWARTDKKGASPAVRGAATPALARVVSL